MKIIVTGPSGRVGQEVVRKCLENERITRVVILTRTALSGEIESHPKADIIMHQDFTQYSDYLIRRMQGSEACIWAIGARQEQSRADKYVERSVGVDLPIATAKILCDNLADKTPEGVKFRFVYCSPKHTEKSKKTFVFASDTRKLANDLEKGIAEVVSLHRSVFEAYTLRPANFKSTDTPLPVSSSAPKKLVSSLGHNVIASIDPERVGRAMVMIACDGWKEKVVENETILRLTG